LAQATWTACAAAAAATRSTCALGKRWGSEESKCSREYNSLFHPEVLPLLNRRESRRRARNLVRYITERVDAPRVQGNHGNVTVRFSRSGYAL
jgi:hypothetical protein